MMKLAVALAFAAISVSANANLVTNGDFETGTFEGWTKSGNTSLSDVISNTVTSNTTYVWRSGATGSPAIISQGLTTSAGGSYTLSFDVFNTATNNAIFSVSFDGSEVFSFSNEVHNWTHYEFENLTASTSLTQLMFSARNDPSFLRLDNVNVVEALAPADVPEPAMLGLFGFGAIGLGLSRRRKAA